MTDSWNEQQDQIDYLERAGAYAMSNEEEDDYFNQILEDDE
jgi:hypothetical protein